MKHSAGDKNNIASLTKHCRLFQFQLECTRDDTNNFILCMPVILHVIAWAVRCLVIKSNREIKGSLLRSFLIINIFHKILSP